jgi:hypothetical protein
LQEALAEKKLCENDIAHVNEQINTEKGKLLSAQNILAEDKERLAELKIKLSDAEKYKLSLVDKAAFAAQNTKICNNSIRFFMKGIKELWKKRLLKPNLKKCSI